MDDTDFSLFGQKNKHKKDKADATQTARTPTSELDFKRIIISRPTTEDTYENCERAGIALILNHKDVKGQKQRVGTERDRDDMEATLKGFGFDVRTYDDLTFSDINDKLKEGEFPYMYVLQVTYSVQKHRSTHKSLKPLYLPTESSLFLSCMVIYKVMSSLMRTLSRLKYFYYLTSVERE